MRAFGLRDQVLDSATAAALRSGQVRQSRGLGLPADSLRRSVSCGALPSKFFFRAQWGVFEDVSWSGSGC